MKPVLKTVCLLTAVLIVFGLCACGEKETVFDDSTITFSFNEKNGSGDAEANSGDGAGVKTDKGKSVSGNSSGNGGVTVDINDTSRKIAAKTDLPYVPMEVPSRANAYKLSNTYGRIRNGESVKVVYLGGSVTGGTGASNDNKTSWRALTTAYLKSISSGEIKEVNAAIGGTGSYFGASRFEYDVSSRNPDLVFIEFAINDVYSGLSEEQSKANLEYMINNLYSANPYADIVIALVTSQPNFGKQYSAYKAHREVADFYGIPVVDLGGELYNDLKGSNAQFEKNFTDSVHPNDSGYQLYANIMIKALKELLVDEPVAAHTVPETRLCKNGYSTLTNIMAGNISAPDWNCCNWSNNVLYEKEGSPFRSKYIRNLFPSYICPNDVNTSLTVSFTGNSFGFVGTVKENVKIDFVIDEKQTKTVKGTSSAGMLEYPVFDNIANGAHTVRLTVTGTPYLAIAAFVTTSK